MPENNNPGLSNNASKQRHEGQWYNPALVIPEGTLSDVHSTDAQQADLILEVSDAGVITVKKDAFGFLTERGA